MTDSVPAFLQAVRQSRLLSPAQMNEMKTTFALGVFDAQILANRLVDAGWLTPYQAEQLLQGNDREFIVGPYRLLTLLGEGGLGQVYRAWDSSTRQIVALKILHPELRHQREVLDQLRLEMEVIAKLAHPAFVRPVDVDVGAGQYYFAMEFVEGIELSKLLKKVGPLPVAQACDYARQAAVGLQYAFEQGLVHRDIKPANLLVHYDTDQVRILDIGLARLEWSVADKPSPHSPTPGTTVMGTPDYLAPEQALDPGSVDIRADIYSLGCTLYQLLTGAVPYPGNSLARKLLQHQQAPPPSVHDQRKEVSSDLAAVIQKMMAKHPADRFTTPLAVSVALAPFCKETVGRVSVAQFKPPLTVYDRMLQLEPDEEPTTPSHGGNRTSRAQSYGQPGQPERRVHPRRMGNPVPILLRDPTGGGEPLRGWVLNRSQGGLGLLVEEAVEIGTIAQLSPNTPGLSNLWFTVGIIYCFQERLRWRVGVQFGKHMSWDELRLFG